MRISWGQQDLSVFSHENEISFIAQSGRLIVPLEAYPRWLTMKHISRFKISLSEGHSCQAISLQNIGFYQKNVFQDLRVAPVLQAQNLH